MPEVSIIIPVYNGSDYLREAIESALAQSYSNTEIIVVNDGSTDGGMTEEIALFYGSAIRYFHKGNGGVASALNLGIREMKGEYFSWLSHDDVYYPNKISSQMAFLKEHSGYDIILYSNYDLIDMKSQIFGAIELAHVPAPHQMRYSLMVNYPVNGCTTLIPKVCFERCGLFNEALRTTQDYDMWFRLAAEYDFVHMADKLIQSRQHPGQGTQTMNALHLREVDELLSGFLNGLRKEEIASAARMDISRAYAAVAASFHERHFWKSARLAKLMALRSLSGVTLSSTTSVLRSLLLMFLKDVRRAIIARI